MFLKNIIEGLGLRQGTALRCLSHADLILSTHNLSKLGRTAHLLFAHTRNGGKSRALSAVNRETTFEDYLNMCLYSNPG